MKTAILVFFVCLVTTIVNFAIIRGTEKLFGWDWTGRHLWLRQADPPANRKHTGNAGGFRVCMHGAADIAIRGLSAIISFISALAMFFWFWTGWIQ